jgi:hypothetical protein
MWHNTLDLMALQPGADLPLLQRVRAWITDGVTLDLVSTPDCVHHENTFSVSQEQDAVRTRIHEYIAFGAIVALPADHRSLSASSHCTSSSKKARSLALSSTCRAT